MQAKVLLYTKLSSVYQSEYICFLFTYRCYSEVGRIGGPQVLSIDVHCFKYHTTMFNGTILHEIMHTLGFWHEHTRPDRDQYIRVNFDNVQPGRLFYVYKCHLCTR